jgi:S-layer homology domain
VFGRRKREEAAAAEAAREAERHALFAKLAERPENICPFLGLAGERPGYVDGISDEHRCFAFGDPIPLSAEQQTRVCQERGYGNCPRYLRGVLVIPTEELEALRQRRAPAEVPTATSPRPQPAGEGAGRRRAPVLLLGVLLLAIAAGGAGAYFLLGDRGGVAVASPTPSVAASSTPVPTTPASPTVEPTPLPTARPEAWGWVGCQPDERRCAGEDVFRDEMALYLSRAFVLPPYEGLDRFIDIADNRYRPEINAVSVAELTVGCTATEYCPDGLVTREQMATFIQRAFDIPPSDTDSFTDDDDSTHEAAINAVTAAGVMEGCGNQVFCPDETVTRGETAAFLDRAQNFASTQ